ncbi:recombination regulator RecX [Kerstersia gyiorum]|uniref:recombination regulator RecX n=1 Tax=Kerstersia gyiorum TaxID=206506 RepID=UPI00209E18CC|nr:recombination regulator RecX [Kerstersia gyiorum]MCP1634562.1 regulatory protein [Kerstersia gyiorum]MCP1683701.1 regulatory protein [Kerstersia gyiorum]MCP1719371.1 regulatory protein [Kerstersia gyiorum]MCW2186899.1 regulatory protein [Kerstersia gyiorum]
MSSDWRKGGNRLGGRPPGQRPFDDTSATARKPARATLGDAYVPPDEDEDFEFESGAGASTWGSSDAADGAVGTTGAGDASEASGMDDGFAPPLSRTSRSASARSGPGCQRRAGGYLSSDPEQAPAERRGPTLKARAVGLLSRREYSRKELSGRLAPHAPDPETLTALLDDLQREGWLSDERYARSMLNQRSARQGERRIIGDLRRQGVVDELLETLSEDLRATELERAVQVWRKRFEGKALPDTPQEYARQARFLAARGFGGNVVGKVLKAALRGHSGPEGLEDFLLD